MSPPPHGGVWVRNPQVDRANAIRERVARHHKNGTEVPEHLQKLYDTLQDNPGGSGVELHDNATGDVFADVDVIARPYKSWGKT
jgi:hypothetical protein